MFTGYSRMIFIIHRKFQGQNKYAREKFGKELEAIKYYFLTARYFIVSGGQDLSVDRED